MKEGLNKSCHPGKHLLLVATNVFSKWPEVHLISSTSAKQTIEKLWVMLATCDISITRVSNNGPLFVSTEFKEYINANGVNLHRVPPYHPLSIEATENLVKFVKRKLKIRHQDIMILG